MQSLEDQRDKSDSANQAKSEFLANMSHEIRTPMNAVLGFTEILKSKERDQEKFSYLERIHSSGKTLMTLINDILDLSKIESGKMELQYSITSIVFILKEMNTIFERKVLDKGVDFQVETEASVPEALLIDETRLRQILINLIGNAIKFTDTGFIRLLATAIETDQVIGSRIDLTISIEDTGIGIPPDQQEKIFGAFEQMEGQKMSQFGGTGLGLSITKGLVELMGGVISITSEQGRGSCFKFTLPGVEVSSGKVKKEEWKLNFDSISFEPATILITDDIDYNRELFISFFKNWKFKIITANNGKETIEKARQFHPDLILLDMKMPVMDGYEASEILSKDSELKSIPVVAVTASALKKDKDIISEKCDGYLRKPVSKSDLIHEVMKFLPHHVSESSTPVNLLEVEASSLILTPPIEEMHKLNEIAMQGDRDEIKAYSVSIEQRSPKYAAFTDDFSKLPSNLIEGLADASLKLDSGSCLRLITKINDINKSVAKTLTILVKEYRFDEIYNMIHH